MTLSNVRFATRFADTATNQSHMKAGLKSTWHLSFCADNSDRSAEPQRIEALAIGRWVAISGAAFTTGTGANTSVGLSLLLGLGNVRLGSRH